jgi:hypothetical protein
VTELDAPFVEALHDLRAALSELGVPWLVIGGLAVIARGVPRFTADVDATFVGDDVSIDHVFEVLTRHGIEPRMPDAIGFARERHVVLVRHARSGVPFDLSVAWLPFERDAIRRGEARDYAGVTLPVAQAEDLVIYKLVAFRPRDLDDVERLLLLHGAQLDVRRIVDTVRDFAVALDDTERIPTLRRLLQRAGLAEDSPT